jgi:hypothetical protein
MRTAQDEALVDVLGGGEAGFDHPDGREQERDEQCVDHEARAVLAVDGTFAKDDDPVGELTGLA